MSLRCRWVVVRDGREGKRWQLVFPDGRVLKTIPAGSTRVLGQYEAISRPDALATAAADAKKPQE
jgi:hypothetical protein